MRFRPVRVPEMLFSIFLVASTCLVSLTSKAVPNCSSIFVDQDKIESPAFLAKENRQKFSTTDLFSRIYGHAVDPDYLENTIAALKNVFEPWIQGKRKLTTEQFVSQLQEMHFYARGGHTGKDYTGVSKIDNLQDNIFGLNVYTSDLYIEKVDMDPLNKELFSRKWRVDVVNRWPTIKDIWMRSWQPADQTIQDTSVRYTKIAGIRNLALPRHFFVGKPPELESWTFSYPPARFVPEYLAQMAKTLNAVQAEIHGEKNIFKIIELLADYHQLFTNAHPFVRVNNSICMAQINYILESIGLHGIAHGDLDYWSYYLSYPEYRKLFREAIAERNPNFQSFTNHPNAH